MMSVRKKEFSLSEEQKARLDRVAIGAGVVRIRTQSASALRRHQLQADAETKRLSRIHPVGYLPAAPTAFDTAWWRSSEFARVRERELAELWFDHGRNKFAADGTSDTEAAFSSFWDSLQREALIAEKHFAKYWFKAGRATASSALAAEQRSN
jgi:hypothetical protein